MGTMHEEEEAKPCCSLFGGGDIPPRLRKLALFIISFWLLLSPLYVLYAPHLQGETSLDFAAPSGHPSAKAHGAMVEYFPVTDKSSIVVVVISATQPNGSVVDPIVERFSKQVTNDINNSTYKKDLEVKISGYYISQNPLMREEFLAKNHRSMVISLLLNNPGSTAKGSTYDKFVQWLRNPVLKGYGIEGFEENYTADVTGQKVLSIDASKGTIEDAAHADFIVIPVAFFILACFLRSWRLMILPLITIGICLGAAFAACYPIAKSMTVQSTTPQLMMSATLALNIDYNLFLLMRFRENHDLGMRLYENLKLVVLHTASETVLGSGSLVSVAFFAMGIIPCEALITTGLCCGITVAIVVLVNITLTPSLLAVFGDFFAVPVRLPECIKQRYCRKSDEENGLLVQSNEATCKKKELAQKESVWFRIACFVQRYPVPVIIVALGLCAGLYIRFPDIKTNLDPFAFVPRNAQSAKTWRSMANDFPPGKFNQYYLIVTTPKDSKGLVNPAGFDALYDLMDTTITNTAIGDYRKLGGTPREYFYGPINIPLPSPQPVPLADSGFTNKTVICHGTTPCSGKECVCNVTAVTFSGKSVCSLNFTDPCWEKDPLNFDALPYTLFELLWKDPSALPAALRALSPVVNSVIDDQTSTPNKEGSRVASYIRVFTPFEPTGEIAREWIGDMLTLLDKYNAKYSNASIEAHLSGGNTINYDFNKIVDGAMYKMLGVLIAAIVVIVTIVFRSAAIPLVMAITIAYSTASAFGLAYYFFQTTSFSWFYPYLGDLFVREGLSWSVPPMAISITVALAIDYDIFMLTRIAEYRKTYTDDAAVLKGVYAVGSTICGAGIIMSVAFGGLLFSHVEALNEFSIILVSSVILDTFLLSTIFVPACAFLLKRRFWWPRAVPEGGHSEWHFEDESLHDDQHKFQPQFHDDDDEVEE